MQQQLTSGTSVLTGTRQPCYPYVKSRTLLLPLKPRAEAPISRFGLSHSESRERQSKQSTGALVSELHLFHRVGSYRILFYAHEKRQATNAATTMKKSKDGMTVTANTVAPISELLGRLLLAVRECQ